MQVKLLNNTLIVINTIVLSTQFQLMKQNKKVSSWDKAQE